MQEAPTIVLCHPAFPVQSLNPLVRLLAKKKKETKFLLYYRPSSTAVSSPKLLTPPTSHLSSQCWFSPGGQALILFCPGSCISIFQFVIFIHLPSCFTIKTNQEKQAKTWQPLWLQSALSSFAAFVPSLLSKVADPFGGASWILPSPRKRKRKKENLFFFFPFPTLPFSPYHHFAV